MRDFRNSSPFPDVCYFLMSLYSEFVFSWNPSQPIRELSVSFERFAVSGNKDVMAKQCGAPQRYFSDQEERQSYRKPNEAHIPGTAADIVTDVIRRFHSEGSLRPDDPMP